MYHQLLFSKQKEKIHLNHGETMILVNMVKLGGIFLPLSL